MSLFKLAVNHHQIWFQSGVFHVSPLSLADVNFPLFVGNAKFRWKILLQKFMFVSAPSEIQWPQSDGLLNLLLSKVLVQSTLRIALEQTKWHLTTRFLLKNANIVIWRGYFRLPARCSLAILRNINQMFVYILDIRILMILMSSITNLFTLTFLLSLGLNLYWILKNHEMFQLL